MEKTLDLKNMDSVFAQATEDDLDFETIFEGDIDDQLVDIVEGITDDGEFILDEAVEFDLMHQEDTDTPIKDMQDELGPDHDVDLGAKEVEGSDEVKLENEPEKSEEKSDAEEILNMDLLDQEHQDGKDNGKAPEGNEVTPEIEKNIGESIEINDDLAPEGDCKGECDTEIDPAPAADQTAEEKCCKEEEMNADLSGNDTEGDDLADTTGDPIVDEKCCKEADEIEGSDDSIKDADKEAEMNNDLAPEEDDNYNDSDSAAVKEADEEIVDDIDIIDAAEGLDPEEELADDVDDAIIADAEDELKDLEDDEDINLDYDPTDEDLIDAALANESYIMESAEREKENKSLAKRIGNIIEDIIIQDGINQFNLTCSGSFMASFGAGNGKFFSGKTNEIKYEIKFGTKFANISATVNGYSNSAGNETRTQVIKSFNSHKQDIIDRVKEETGREIATLSVKNVMSTQCLSVVLK